MNVRVGADMLALTRVAEQRREHCWPGYLWLLHIHTCPEDRRQDYTTQPALQRKCICSLHKKQKHEHDVIIYSDVTKRLICCCFTSPYTEYIDFTGLTKEDIFWIMKMISFFNTALTYTKLIPVTMCVYPHS